MSEQEEQIQETTSETIAENETAQAEAAVEEDIKNLQDQLQRLTDERDDLRQQVLRTMADFQNFRKRNQAEAVLLRQFATENLVRELLPVLDNFERTIDHVDSGATVESSIAGIKAVEKQLRSALEAQNVKRIETVGEPFDPEVHEALGTDPESEYEDDMVSAEIEAGYKMGDKIIRPARVRVARKA